MKGIKMKMYNRTALLAVLALMMIAPAPPATGAVDTQTQQTVDAVIAAHGGVQVSPNTIEWNDGAVVLEIRDGIVPLADTCASGKYCAFQYANFSGSVLSYSACPATYTDFSAIWGTVGSVSNKRTSGTVRALQGTTVKAILTPGKSVALLTGINKITCS